MKREAVVEGSLGQTSQATESETQRVRSHKSQKTERSEVKRIRNPKSRKLEVREKEAAPEAPNAAPVTGKQLREIQ